MYYKQIGYEDTFYKRLVFFEGLSNVGKTTILNQVKKQLEDKGYFVFVLTPSRNDDIESLKGLLNNLSNKEYLEIIKNHHELIEVKHKTIHLLNKATVFNKLPEKLEPQYVEEYTSLLSGLMTYKSSQLGYFISILNKLESMGKINNSIILVDRSIISTIAYLKPNFKVVEDILTNAKKLDDLYGNNYQPRMKTINSMLLAMGNYRYFVNRFTGLDSKNQFIRKLVYVSASEADTKLFATNNIIHSNYDEEFDKESLLKRHQMDKKYKESITDISKETLEQAEKYHTTPLILIENKKDRLDETVNEVVKRILT